MSGRSLKLAIVVGSTRPGRNAEAVARWVHEIARRRAGVEFELVDIANFDLPLLDEPLGARASAMMKRGYTRPHTDAWSTTIDAFDGYVFVTPEYNFGPPAALKNALDYLYAEWNDKAAGFVSYGAAGGIRAAQQLRLVLAELQVATVRNEVNLSLLTDFENYTDFKPAPTHAARVDALLDQLIAWSGAFKSLRSA